MKEQAAPGTTFRKHHEIAKGLLSEDDFLLSEILLNPEGLKQIVKIKESLNGLIKMIEARDTKALHNYLAKVRANFGMK